MSAEYKRANGVTSGAVLAYLQQEADLDGLVTVALSEVGECLGVDKAAVHYHIDQLVEQGMVVRAGRTSGIKGHSISAYQLSEEAMA